MTVPDDDLIANAEILADELERRECLTLSGYIRQAWSIIEPATPLLWNWHIDILADYLEAVSRGQITRLAINMPPRYMKSITVSVMWPTWEWGPGGRPGNRWVFWSYAQTLSTKHSVDRRTIIESDWYRARWPEVDLVGDQNMKTEYVNRKRGHMIATSMGGSAHGKGGTRLVLDDVHNPKQALSLDKMEAAELEYRQSIVTRLDDRKAGAIVLVMQRLSTKDLGQYCIDHGYELLKLDNPCQKHTVVLSPSGHRVERPEGNILWPERESAEIVDQMRVTLGEYGFAGQYLQEPVPIGGGIIKQAWLNDHYWEVLPATQVSRWIQSWDMSFKDTDGTDYVVGQVWLLHQGACYYLVDQVRARMDFPTTCEAIKQLSAKWPQALKKLIEDKANGPAVIAALKKQVPGMVEVEPKGSKLARLAAVSPLFEAGNVWIPSAERAQWVQDYVVELCTFPKGKNDDQVDATSQALAELSFGTTQTGVPVAVGERGSYWKRT